MQHYLTLIPDRVTIPYESGLSRLIRPKAVRLRRDFDAICTLIRGHALLHHETPERDDNGVVITAIDDYAVVRALVNEIVSEGAGIRVTAKDRETYQAVADLIAAGKAEVSQADLVTKMNLDKGTVSRRANEATKGLSWVSISALSDMPVK